jgi:hypothetical protein
MSECEHFHDIYLTQRKQQHRNSCMHIPGEGGIGKAQPRADFRAVLSEIIERRACPMELPRHARRGLVPYMQACDNPVAKIASWRTDVFESTACPRRTRSRFAAKTPCVTFGFSDTNAHETNGARVTAIRQVIVSYLVRDVSRVRRTANAVDAWTCRGSAHPRTCQSHRARVDGRRPLRVVCA